MAKTQPKQYHNLPFYLGIAAATTLAVGLPAVAAVRISPTSATTTTVQTASAVPQTVKDGVAAATDAYTNNLATVVEANKTAISSANTVTLYLTPSFVKNKIDITTLTAKIAAANAAVQLAETSVANLDTTNAEQVATATANVLLASQATITLNQELDAVVNQLPKQ